MEMEALNPFTPNDDGNQISTYKFLGNHAAHADANDVDLALTSPADMAKDFDNVLGHLRRRVPSSGLIGVTNASIVDYQR